MLNEDVSQDGDDGPAGHVEEGADHVEQHRQPEPNLEGQERHRDQVQNDADQGEHQVREEQRVNRVADFDAAVHAVDADEQESEIDAIVNYGRHCKI